MIVLIRHGKTEANLNHLYCGSTDLPLSGQGREALAGLHYDFPGARYLTSGMKRTNETLHLLFGEVPFEERPAFREVDFGIFEMKSYDMLKDTSEYQAWLTGDNERNVPPRGESGEQMTNRVLTAFAQLEAEHADTVLITHGGVIAAIMAAKFPEENKNRYQWQPKPGEGYVLDGSRYSKLIMNNEQ